VAARKFERRTKGRKSRPSAPTGSSGPPNGASDQPATTATGEPEALSVTHWFDSGIDGEPYTATVRFSGNRLGVRGKAGPRDSFTKEETIKGVVPGSGRVSITTWVHGLNPGQWNVTAELVAGPSESSWRRALRPHQRSGTPLPRAAWSWWRWSLDSASFGPVMTRWAPLVRLTAMPAVVRGSWSGLIAVGILVGILVQTSLLSRAGIGVGEALLVDFAALAAGLIGAKLWYVALRPGAWRKRIGEGFSIDGSIVFGPVVGVIAMLGLALPVGGFLDASTPAFFFGMAIGRLGCFLTGCCAGRCTRGRWGVWSSDRRVGARRVPAQLLESGIALAIGIVTLLLVTRSTAFDGAVFVGGAAAYILARQWLLRLRAEPREPSIAQPLTAGAAALVLVLDAIAMFAGAV